MTPPRPDPTTMSEAGKTQLGDVVAAIRSVEASLDRRHRQATAINVMIWGFAAAGVFLFYQLAQWNEALYEDLFGPTLPWMWAPSIGMGYVLTSIVSLQAGRRTKDAEHFREVKRNLVGAAVVFVVVGALVVSGEYLRIPGFVILFCGVQVLLSRPARTWFPSLALGGIGLIGGAALLALPQTWSWLAAMLYFGIGLVGLGLLMRFRAE